MIIRLIESEVRKEFPGVYNLDFSKEYLVDEILGDDSVIIKICNLVGTPTYYMLTKGCYEENIVGREVLIYNKGERLGSVIDPTIYPKETCTALLVVVFDDKKYNVLQIIDMDYGIVIPADVAKKMNDTLKKREALK